MLRARAGEGGELLGMMEDKVPSARERVGRGVLLLNMMEDKEVPRA